MLASRRYRGLTPAALDIEHDPEFDWEDMDEADAEEAADPQSGEMVDHDEAEDDGPIRTNSAINIR